MKHHYLSGSHLEIGIRLGKLARPGIREVVFGLEQFLCLRDLWHGSDRLAAFEALSRKHFPEFVAEIEGIAQGAEVSFEDIFIWNCRGDLPPASGQTKESGSYGCTTVMEDCDQSGHIKISHNEDGSASLAGKCSMVTLRPTGGVEVTSFYYPGMISGHNFGFNCNGLVQTINNICPVDYQVGIPRHIICRAVLASATLDTALQHLQRSDRASGFHHTLAQVGDTRLLSVEAPASCSVVNEVKGWHTHTNHLIEPEFESVAQIVSDSSSHRLLKSRKMVAQGMDALDILSDTSHSDFPICLRDPVSAASAYTLASAMFDISKDSLKWSVFDDPRKNAVLGGMLREPQ